MPVVEAYYIHILHCKPYMISILQGSWQFIQKYSFYFMVHKNKVIMFCEMGQDGQMVVSLCKSMEYYKNMVQQGKEKK